MKKKLLCTALLLCLLGAAPIAACADETDGTTPFGIDVTGEYQPTAIPEVVSVDVAWDAMNFTYNDADNIWDPETHTYTNYGTPTWQWDGATPYQSAPGITLTNDSNVGVIASFAFAPTVDGVTASFTGTAQKTEGSQTKNLLLVDSAKEGTAPGDAPSETAYFSIDGGSINGEAELGNITVTITTAPVVEVSTYDALRNAANSKSNLFIRLTNDILDGNSNIPFWDDNQICVLDLNDHTLARPVIVDRNSNLTVKNGTIKYNGYMLLDVEEGSHLTAENCIFDGYEDVVVMSEHSTAAFRNCTINGNYNKSVVLDMYKSAVVFSGDTRINHGEFKMRLDDGCSITLLDGSYNFDPIKFAEAKDESGEEEDYSQYVHFNKDIYWIYDPYYEADEQIWEVYSWL